MKYSGYFLAFQAVILLAQDAFARNTEPCYVCQTKDRFIVDKETSFELADIFGDKYQTTCGGIEQQGLSVIQSHRTCGSLLAAARTYCECGGPPVGPPPIIDTSPACNICIDGRTVHPLREEEEVETNVAGRFPCGFLYQVAQDGYMPAAFCGEIQASVADFCCNPPDDPPPPQPVKPDADCLGIGKSCEVGGTPCCSRFICRTKPRLGDVCSLNPAKKKVSLFSTSRGGARGRANDSN